MLLRGQAFARTLRLRHRPSTPVATFCTASPGSNKMDKEQQKPNKNTGDVMSHSFGDGYSTRADEEGFGGVYSDNQTLRKDNNPSESHEVHENHPNHPEYDKSQGSEVAEKEGARNQPVAN